MSWQKFLAGFDLHGQHQEEEVVEKFFDFSELWKPQIRIAGGDIWDFSPIRTKANEAEKRQSMEEDYDAGMDFIRRWRPTVFLRGNHDERLWDAKLNGVGPLKDLATAWVDNIETLLAKIKCQMFPWHKRLGIYQMGQLCVIHGFFVGETACKRHAIVYGSCLHGHTHSVDSASVAGLQKREARAAGCLCELDFDYNRGQPLSLRQGHGWAYGIVNTKTGDYHLWQARDLGGRWLLPIDVVTL